ncbi:hypothetical protein [Nocardia crassostreae]|uniref:hypothetical protein n=1 Tax=Nocardia crassostreae TaxID=53428 RepID=UPI00082DE657|nr:hypothetical protein [Nocardia crassostreae]
MNRNGNEGKWGVLGWIGWLLCAAVVIVAVAVRCNAEPCSADNPPPCVEQNPGRDPPIYVP